MRIKEREESEKKDRLGDIARAIYKIRLLAERLLTTASTTLARLTDDQ